MYVVTSAVEVKKLRLRKFKRHIQSLSGTAQRQLVLWLQSLNLQQPTTEMFKSIHLSNKYLLSSYYVLGSVLDAEDNKATKTDQSSCPQVAYNYLHWQEEKPVT